MGETSRFFDAATGEPNVRLELRQDGDGFAVLRRIGYRDPACGDLVVPACPEHFRTDLTSVPWAFAWLVPGLGTHVPAVLLHDGLVREGHEGKKTHIGVDVDRVEADRILREAMGSLGTPVLRRWIMWAGVSVATCLAERAKEPWRAVVAVGTVVVIAVLGVLATLDLFDVVDPLPWMGDRPWWVELLGGSAFALLVPGALAALWRRLWRAGLIVGVGLAFLLHVTVAVAVVYGLYRVAEAVVSRGEGGGNPRRNLARQVPPADAEGVTAGTCECVA